MLELSGRTGGRQTVGGPEFLANLSVYAQLRVCSLWVDREPPEKARPDALWAAGGGGARSPPAGPVAARHEPPSSAADPRRLHPQGHWHRPDRASFRNCVSALGDSGSLGRLTMGIGFAIVYSALYQAGCAWQRWVH